MTQKISKIDLALALAKHVHETHYKLESRIELPPVLVFDDLCMGSFQIPAGVLTKLGVLRPLDGSFRRHVFTCEKEKFGEVIEANLNHCCSYDTLVLALICLAEFHGKNDSEIFRKLVELGLCETDYKYVSKGGGNFKVLDQNGREVVVPKIQWTDKKGYYDNLDWPELIA